MRNLALWLIVAALVACGGPQTGQPVQPPGSVGTNPAASRIAGPQEPPVEFGKRPPNKPMTSATMPFFDTVAYCERTTRRIDKIVKGPAYESCVEDQANYRMLIGDAVDASQFKEAEMVHCASASRTAYQGMWFCMNHQEF